MPKLKNISVRFISLVDKAANHREFIFKSDGKPDGVLDGIIKIRKIDEEKRLVLGVVYTPYEVDTQGEYADAGTIERAAHNFLKNLLLHNVDTQHDFEPEKGYLCESWIIRGVDPVFPDEKEGTWAVAIYVEDDATWELVKSGDLAGLSFAGRATREKINKSTSFTDFFEEQAQADLPWQLASFIYEMVYNAAWSDDLEGLTSKIQEAFNEFSQIREAA